MSPSVAELIEHPERLNKETLFGLRELVARYPYYQAARILFLHNLFILHDASFGEELRRTAIHTADRSVLFKMVEGCNYEIKAIKREQDPREKEIPENGDRTQSLIDRFLHNGISTDETQTRRKPTPADATTDYMAYLLQMEDAASEDNDNNADERNSRDLDLIDEFIEHKPERIALQASPQYTPPTTTDETEGGNEEDFFTETLAKIYIKQGRYEKAMEIIRKLGLNYPKKSRYFADQLRFLQKLIINNKYNKQ